MARRLLDRLFESQIEWPPGQNHYFIPVDDIDSLVTYDNVITELRRLDPARTEQELSLLANFICCRAKKIFTILLYVRRLESVFGIIQEDISDDDLPFTRCYRNSTAGFLASSGPFTLCKRSRKCHQRANHRNCGIQEITGWGQRDISAFCRDQWLVQAPVFQKLEDGSIPHYDLDDNAILPFVEDNELQNDQAVSSGYSHVWGVRIHAAHQNLYRLSHAPNDAPLLAIKRPFSLDPLDFKKEKDMLSELAVRSHPHLIRLLATYKFKGKYHLVFPYAASNLRSFWNQTGLPHWNRETYLWTLHQLRGIAAGLDVIHNFKTTEPLGSQPANQTLHIPSGGNLKVARSEEKFGRHGDIKPENILWFNDVQAEGGMMQIADMGLGRFHRLDSRSRVDPRGISGSPTYCPPEIARGLPVSRAYDIWSLGCVFLECITWLLEGSPSIYRFASARGLLVAPGIDDDTFFTVSTNAQGEKVAEVREGVKSWITRLRGNPRCSPMVDQLLTLVHDQMLVVESKKRMTADNLVSKLTQILDRASRETTYLLGQNPSSAHHGAGMKQPQQDDGSEEDPSAHSTTLASPAIRIELIHAVGE